ncbi:unnamed protein product [Rotaria sp. Silwood2]|nr:unnamed protein product [Rotaria sp. Silwood2]CAF4308083.1 unnamed protein product [Rotaria sp. Silwood2]
MSTNFCSLSNIFRISFDTFDEVIKIVNAPDFKIGNAFATVYLRADCSFLEDLPPNTNDDKISSAIAIQVEENKLQPTSFYVQYNKDTGNAVVLATRSNKKWTADSFLTIDGGKVPKKPKLANRVVRHDHVNDHLIVELDDMNNYENCLSSGALLIDNHMMQVAVHTTIANPEENEITAENWYETEMLDIKPDIMTMINNPQHLIFRYKWNAQIWIEQMKKNRSERLTINKI